jgi:hypothetical protein
MTQWFRTRRPVPACRAALIVVALWGTGSPSEASAEETSPSIRSESPIVRSAIARATERSATFRRLIESLEATDGLIYIIEGQCPRGVGACLHMSVGIAGPRRILRILVNPRWFPGCQMVQAIAHELQHAMEALADRNVRTSMGLYRLFERIGPTGSGTFETLDALDMGAIVAREACRKP